MHSGVVTVLAAAFRSAGRADGKALAVQLETLSLLTVTSHGRYFLSMERVDL